MLGKKIARLCLHGVGEEDRGLRLCGIAVLGKKKKTERAKVSTFKPAGNKLIKEFPLFAI